MTTTLPEAIRFPDIEGALIAHLEPLLEVPVSTRIRSTYPFVLIKRVGGPRANLITDRPLVTVEAWAENSVAAEDLAAKARAHIGATEQTHVNGAWVRSVTEVVGLMDHLDPVTETPRYTFTVQLDVRGELL